MNVSLGEKWETFVERKVRSGDFQTASEVLREGLRLMEERDLLKRISVSSMAELEAKLMEGVASLERGEGIDGEEAFKRLRQRAKRKRGVSSFCLPRHWMTSTLFGGILPRTIRMRLTK